MNQNGGLRVCVTGKRKKKKEKKKSECMEAVRNVEANRFVGKQALTFEEEVPHQKQGKMSH